MFTNCLFIGNSAALGGAVYSHVNSMPTFNNCTLYGNTATRGSGFYVYNGTTIVNNTICWNPTGADEIYINAGTAQVNYSCIRNGWVGINNLQSDPLFLDSFGPDGVAGTGDEDLRLQQSSSSIDAGDVGYLPIGIGTDLSGAPRVSSCRIDQGAFESIWTGDSDGDGLTNCEEEAGGIIDGDGDNIPNYLDLDSDNDGLDDAYEGADDFDGDGLGNFLDIDSDNDGVLDRDESLADEDGDGLPGYLDFDSDNDGVADRCDVDLFPLLGNDCDGNGILDSCEEVRFSVPDASVETRYTNGSVAINDDVAVIGAYQDDPRGVDSGSVAIYRHVNRRWILEQVLIPDDGEADEHFGWSVDIEGDLVIVGGLSNDLGPYAGAVYVFRYDGVGWNQEAKLIADNGNAGDYFGWSVSVNDGSNPCRRPHRVTHRY